MQNENTNSNKDIESSKKSFLSRKIDTITNQYFKFPKSAQKQHFKTVMIIIINIYTFLKIVHANTQLLL